MARRPLVTVGHGTLELSAFIELLRHASVDLVVDVRAFPGSRRQRHFGRERLAAGLASAGIAYRWDPRLGGRRRAQASSRNTALHHAAFRAYADHMASTEFSAAIAELMRDVDACVTAIMCAESVWWRCHRRLIADHVILVDGRAVEHLFHDGRRARHEPAAAARVEGGVVVYDAGEPALPGMDATGC